jgi:hypothetical protein
MQVIWGRLILSFQYRYARINGHIRSYLHLLSNIHEIESTFEKKTNKMFIIVIVFIDIRLEKQARLLQYYTNIDIAIAD